MLPGQFGLASVGKSAGRQRAIFKAGRIGYTKRQASGFVAPPIASIVGCAPPATKNSTILQPLKPPSRDFSHLRPKRPGITPEATGSEQQRRIGGITKACGRREATKGGAYPRSLIGDERQENGAGLYGTSQVMPRGKTLQEVGRLREIQPSH